MKIRRFYSHKVFKVLALTLLCTLAVSGCQKSKSEDGSSGGTPGSPSVSGEFTTDCGTVVNQSVRNPVNARDGETVEITQVVSHNTVIINRNGGTQAIKLRGIQDSISSSANQAARDVLSRQRGTAVLFTDDCSTNVESGGLGVIGELFTPDGVSITERIINRARPSIEANGSCGEGLVSACYFALNEGDGGGGTPPVIGGVTDFLWIPELPSDGVLAVLLNPAGATIKVNGDTLVDTGASQGRGTTGRTNKSGCTFGGQISVEVFSAGGEQLSFANGETTLNIPDGCSRFEL